MFDLQVIRKNIVCERGNGKTLQINRVYINGGGEQWDIAFWRGQERLGGTPLFDSEFEKLKRVINEL